MTRPAPENAPSDSLTPWARLLDRHRDAWTAQVLRGWSIVDLANNEDPAAALAKTSDQTAFVWLDGYFEAEGRDRLSKSLEEAGRRKAPIVIGFDTDRDGVALREAEISCRALDGAQIVTQELAAGSMIGLPDAVDTTASRRRSVRLLVCANLEPGALGGPSCELGIEAEPLMTDYLAWLEQANGELRAANARLGRERLGIHDAAAAAIEDRRVRLEERVAELHEQLEHHQEALLEAERALGAPRYRAVDALRELGFTLPGVSWFLRLRSRRLQRRWRPRGDLTGKHRTP